MINGEGNRHIEAHRKTFCLLMRLAEVFKKSFHQQNLVSEKAFSWQFMNKAERLEPGPAAVIELSSASHAWAKLNLKERGCGESEA